MSLRYPSGFISAGFNPLEVPNAPTIGTATFVDATSVSVTFTAPANVGGSAITGFVATAKKTSDSTTISGTGSSSPITISGLTTGDAYTVTVAAVNSYGLGVSSAASNSVTPVAQELYSWGYNNNGQLAQNNTTNLSSPVQVGALANWYEISGGAASVVVSIKTDNTMWSWGSGGSGGLGLGDTANRSSPVQIGALTNWTQTAIGSAGCHAIKTDGTMWGWGYNLKGQIGQNDTVDRSSPVQVGGLTNWKNVARGYNHTVSVKTDGTMWSWGENNFGQLGQNNTTNRSSPVQIGALAEWSSVSCGRYSSIAVKTNGTMWTWGRSNKGQLGQNDFTDHSSPVQVGALTTWLKIASQTRQCFAIKTDGTLWAWGEGSYGKLGINAGVNERSSPVQIGALTTWYEVAAGRQHTLAIQTNETLWSWGSGGSGGLGLGDTANRSSPTQIGSETTWQNIAAGSNISFAISS